MSNYDELLDDEDTGKGFFSLKVLSIVLVTVIILGGLVSARILGGLAEANQTALCAPNRQIVSSVAIVLDATDTLTANHIARQRQTVIDELNHAKPGTQIIIALVNEKDPSQPIFLVEACHPGGGDKLSPLIATHEIHAERWQAFTQPIQQAVTEAATREPAKQSPLLMTIEALLQRPDFDGRVTQRKLVMASDMIEHMIGDGSYSHLRSGEFKKAYQRSGISKQIILPFRGIDVVIDYLRRPQYRILQSLQHQQFWQWLFLSGDANSVQFVGERVSPAKPTEGAATSKLAQGDD